MKNSLEELLGEVFGVSPKEISDASSPDNLPSWDSFNGLKLIESLEKNYKVKLKLEDMARVKNVGDIKALLRKYQKL